MGPLESRRKCEYNIKMYLEEICCEYVKWTQDKLFCLVLVNTAMKFLKSYNF